MGVTFHFNFRKNVRQGKNMKENKDVRIALRISTEQEKALQKLIDQGKAKNKSSAIQYLINQYSVLGK